MAKDGTARGRPPRPFGERELEMVRLSKLGLNMREIAAELGLKNDHGTVAHWLRRAENGGLLPEGWVDSHRSSCGTKLFDCDADTHRAVSYLACSKIPLNRNREKYAEAHRLFAGGMRQNQIARLLGVSRVTLKTWGITVLKPDEVALRREVQLSEYPPLESNRLAARKKKYDPQCGI